MSEHNVVLEKEQEYDEVGNFTGESAQEVCSKCGERTDMVDSNPDCTVEDYEIDTKKVFDSEKKTCTKERLLRVLSAIGDLSISSEGEGGKTAYYGDDYEIGTGLRSPDMPFYYKPRTSRQAVLKHLEDYKLITVKEHNIEGWEGLEITNFGKQVLDEFNICDNCKTPFYWYQSKGFYQTGEKSGFRTDSRIMICECKKKKFLDKCSASQNTNSRMSLGDKIVKK